MLSTVIPVLPHLVFDRGRHLDVLQGSLDVSAILQELSPKIIWRLEGRHGAGSQYQRRWVEYRYFACIPGCCSYPHSTHPRPWASGTVAAEDLFIYQLTPAIDSWLGVDVPCISPRRVAETLSMEPLLRGAEEPSLRGRYDGRVCGLGMEV